jgi:phosphatidylglycerol---prolipoprotein diacylglyceryl transferase
MHPEILSLGPFHIRSYGLMLALGFLAGILLAAYRARKAGENPEHMYNIAVWLVLSSLIGSRLYYIVTHYSEFRAGEQYSLLGRILVEMKNMFWPVGADGQVGLSGLIFYGGLIFATIAAVIYLRYYRLNLLKYLDIMAPSIAIGEMFTRIGCFLNGCCFGHPTNCALGVVFPPESVAGSINPGIPIHPTQLYSSFGALVIVGLILGLERFKRFDGFSAILFFMLYSIARFTEDFFRFYEDGMQSHGLSQNQIISLFIFTVTVVLMGYFSRKASRALPESPR